MRLFVRGIETGTQKMDRKVVDNNVERKEKLTALRKELAIGLNQLDRGEYVEYASVEELFDDIQSEVTKWPRRSTERVK